MMSANSIDEIIDEEEEETCETVAKVEPATWLPPFREVVKSKAREQLDLSIDSPFRSESDRRELELKQKIEAKAVNLRVETAEIRRQLDLVKGRLSKLKVENEEEEERKTLKCEPVLPKKAKAKNDYKKITKVDPKFRPLTGMADCPNCVCDRRTSVCDKCIEVIKLRSPRNINVKGTDENGGLEQAEVKKSMLTRNNENDDISIKPLVGLSVFNRGKPEIVKDVVVPGRVYTISKSLDEKRRKLSQAIEELELLMEKLKKKDQKLDEERKVANLYREQWKFGPNIGGPMASSRERLGVNRDKRNYESRLDSNLARDAKSLNGFQHIDANLKLRHYNKPPKMFSRKSKSLESLKITSNSNKKISQLEKNNSNFDNGKSSSQINLTSTEKQADKYDDEDDIQEEEGMEQIIDDNLPESSSNKSEPSREDDEQILQPIPDTNERKMVQKMAWIPVFGETEIKQVKSTPKRKVQIVSPDSSRPATTVAAKPTRQVRSNSLMTQTSDTSRQPPRGQQSCFKSIRRSLNAASDLLKREQVDSRTKNQLVIKRRSLPSIVESKRPQTNLPSSNPAPLDSRNGKKAEEAKKEPTSSSDSLARDKEIARLEEKLDEQQRLLERLTQLRERMVVSPVTVTCSSPCCHLRRTNGNQQTNRQPDSKSQILNSNKQMMMALKRKLEQTKLKLTKTFEEEFKKYQTPNDSVNSSLKEQADSRREKESLKFELSNYIEACLEDLANTIETLTQNLAGNSTKESSINLNSNSDLNKHLKQMKKLVETIEAQRKDIFEELSKEKVKSNQLELELKKYREDLQKLMDAKQKLQTQSDLLSSRENPQISEDLKEPEVVINCQPSTSSSSRVQLDVNNNNNVNSSSTLTTSQTDTTDRSELDDSYNSIDLYRRYVQSMSLDTESLRRERKLIFSEFDNIKKMLTEIEKQ